jgi:hypothetical protein
VKARALGQWQTIARCRKVTNLSAALQIILKPQLTTKFTKITKRNKTRQHLVPANAIHPPGEATKTTPRLSFFVAFAAFLLFVVQLLFPELFFLRHPVHPLPGAGWRRQTQSPAGANEISVIFQKIGIKWPLARFVPWAGAGLDQT